jgi:hypothetical protein
MVPLPGLQWLNIRPCVLPNAKRIIIKMKDALAIAMYLIAHIATEITKTSFEFGIPSLFLLYGALTVVLSAHIIDIIV